jgi:hypothetical protein
MSGEWLKMECATPDKPEVLALTVKMGWDDPDLTVGKLFRLWRWFDQQTVDGNACGVTAALLDRQVGASGFIQAVSDVGWLLIEKDGIRLPKFDRHNGNTAKSRALTAKRVATHRNNAEGNGATVTGALAREEKKREEQDSGAHTAAVAVDNSLPALEGHEPTKAGSICRAMRQAGMPQTNPGDPRLLALIEQGATEAEFVGIAAEAVEKRKGWGWVLAVLPARRADAAALELAPKTDPPRNDAAEQTAEYLARQDAEFKASDTPENRERVASAIAEARSRLTGAQLRRTQ